MKKLMNKKLDYALWIVAIRAVLCFIAAIIAV
jgi:hypothetical protein